MIMDNNNDNHSNTVPRPATPERASHQRGYCDSLRNDSTGNSNPSDCCAPMKKVKKITPKRNFM